MRKTIAFFSIVVVLLLGCTEEDTVCFLGARIDIKSTLDIDSVLFYLNGEQVCYETVHADCQKCDNKKGYFFETVKCKTNGDEIIFRSLSQETNPIDGCLVSDDFPVWKVFECHIDEKQYGKSLDSSNLVVYVYSEDKKAELKLVVLGGEHYNVVSEQDSAKWYSYTKSSMDFNYDYYGLSNAWEQEGCVQGFCIAKSQRLEKEVCYDK